MASLAEILRLDRALWAQVYERAIVVTRDGVRDFALLEATLIADEALALAELGDDAEAIATAELMLRVAVETLLSLPPPQPQQAFQREWARRLRMSQTGTASPRCAPQIDAPSIQALVRRLAGG